MNYSEAERQKIIEYLKVKPVHHGQLDISQIYVPEKQVISPPDGYVEIINHFQANLHPIVVRRTDQYGEDQEYELIYGGDWYQAAKRAGLTKIWVWVFDLTNEQITQIEQLLNTTAQPQQHSSASIVHLSTQEVRILLAEIIDQKFSIISQKLDEKLRLTVHNFENQINKILDRLPPPPPPKKNIHEVTLAELKQHPKPAIKRNASAIFNFIQNHPSLSNLEDLTQVKGVGKETVKYLAEHYTI